MTLAHDIYSTYQELYETTPEEYWETMAERVSISKDLLKELFSLKYQEYEELQQAIQEYLQNKPVLTRLLENLDERGVSLVEYEAIEQIMHSTLQDMTRESIEELVEDEDMMYFTIALADALLSILEESLDTLIDSVMTV